MRFECMRKHIVKKRIWLSLSVFLVLFIASVVSGQDLMYGDVAIHDIETMIAQEPDDVKKAEWLWVLASVHLISGDEREALGRATEAFLLSEQGDALAHRRFGVLLFQLGRYNEAVEHLRSAIVADDTDFWSHYHLVIVLDELRKEAGNRHRNDEYARSLEYIRKYYEDGATLPSLAHYYIGKYYRELGDAIRAHAHFSLFVQLHEVQTQDEGRMLLDAISYLKSD